MFYDIESKGTTLHRPMDQQLNQQYAALGQTWSCLIADPLESNYLTSVSLNNPTCKTESIFSALEEGHANR